MTFSAMICLNVNNGVKPGPFSIFCGVISSVLNFLLLLFTLCLPQSRLIYMTQVPFFAIYHLRVRSGECKIKMKVNSNILYLYLEERFHYGSHVNRRDFHTSLKSHCGLILLRVSCKRRLNKPLLQKWQNLALLFVNTLEDNWDKKIIASHHLLQMESSYILETERWLKWWKQDFRTKKVL